MPAPMTNRDTPWPAWFAEVKRLLAAAGGDCGAAEGPVGREWCERAYRAGLSPQAVLSNSPYRRRKK